MNTIHIVILLAGYIVLVGTSGKLLIYILTNFSAKPVNQTLSKEVLDTGFIIGKCENILILTFMFLDAYFPEIQCTGIILSHHSHKV